MTEQLERNLLIFALIVQMSAGGTLAKTSFAELEIATSSLVVKC